jgi:uncharacterized protein (TIGR00369 family)
MTSLVELLPQLAAGSPHTHALGIAYVGVEDDKVLVLRAPYREDLIGDPATKVLAGGLITTLLDHACGLSVWVALGRFTSIATLDLRIDYMRAAKPGLDVYARARCYKLTRSIAFVRASAYDEDREDVVAAAQASFMLDSDRPPGAGRKPQAGKSSARAKKSHPQSSNPRGARP